MSTIPMLGLNQSMHLSIKRQSITQSLNKFINQSTAWAWPGPSRDLEICHVRTGLRRTRQRLMRPQRVFNTPIYA